ncbi:Spermine/spermidine synthase family protein [Pyrenophora tritici-repentis]|uniref:Spermine/spermidine synthase family protein n=2 Tax=Pyrenophora tritici-repentis TaxID=45151 RepID=A0A922NRY5_9PLEO|nr:spermine/spermidine synthase family protein [Pyrenophora tritici-repentis Pt-1C-BFP]EDU44404.1 spermine/spermidine synthase family protein [Pyrenophora tritici-repentis Pt-1C-BFP]KAI1519676.1 Spermine/spermidine synthase family protein [Pyrenophora tritici-repentis]KAI1675914.1 Spermine/spermidine synthase family protein [Pyrenophora tritici-repentis]KAI1686883.1 Spermine/spermidine synthase family protein [Pyrenophora tritici-repentis]
MSSKQKTQKKPKAAKEAQKQTPRMTAPEFLISIGRAMALLLIAGVASPISQLNLSPVYGSIPASLHHQRTMTLTAVAALLVRRGLKSYVSVNVSQYIAVVAYWTPVIQFLLFQYSEKLGIEYGPFIVESLTYFPLLFLSVYGAMDFFDCFDLIGYQSSPLKEAIIPTASYFTISTVAKMSSALIPNFIGTSIYFTRIGMQLLLASASAFLTPSRVIVFAFPAILHTLWANPHHPSAHGFQLANSTLQATQNFTILARQESITGYVSVIENDADNAFRLLRCDHSLLGGEWLVTPDAYSKGQRQRESIFAVFVLLEAVRLVEPAVPSLPTLPDSEKSALVIGLGIGTAPNAMIAHGLNTTIVELDPVVHYYATKYFNLSPKHTAVIDDATAYVARTSVSAPGSFDYIMHDVFTGGAEPVYLFTTEFMQGLYDLLKDDGVVAINYAGDLSLGSTKLVLNTIHAIFPACRLFRDTPPREDHKEGDADFINMVVFCVKRDHELGKKAIRFRDATAKDLLGSLARNNFLQPREALEVKYEFVREEEGGKVMGNKDVGALEKFHKDGAVSHWRIMRSVLPAGVWEMW